MGVGMNRPVHHTNDDENAVRRKHSPYFTDSLKNVKNMLKGIAAYETADRIVIKRKPNFRILDSIHTRPFSKVAPDIAPSWKERPEIGIADLRLNL